MTGITKSEVERERRDEWEKCCRGRIDKIINWL